MTVATLDTISLPSKVLYNTCNKNAASVFIAKLCPSLLLFFLIAEAKKAARENENRNQNRTVTDGTLNWPACHLPNHEKVIDDSIFFYFIFFALPSSPEALNNALLFYVKNTGRSIYDISGYFFFKKQCASDNDDWRNCLCRQWAIS